MFLFRLVTFRVSRRRYEMYCGHTRLCVSVCLPAAACQHYCTDPDVTWGNGRGCPLIVNYRADLQPVHGLRCYGNITRTRNVSECMLVLAPICLVVVVSTLGSINACGLFRRRKCGEPEPTSTTITHATNPEYISNDQRRAPQSTKNDYVGVTNADGAYSEIPGGDTLPGGSQTGGNSVKRGYERLNQSQPATDGASSAYQQLQLDSRNT